MILANHHRSHSPVFTHWSADPENGLRRAQKLAGHADMGTTAKSYERVEVEGDC